MTLRRWSPDPEIIMSARAGGVRGAALQPCDRAWTVACLMEGQGMTGAEAASLLRCSLRLIRLIRAEPLYPVAVHAADLTRRLADTETAASRQLKSMSRTVQLHAQELSRMRMQRDQLVDDLATARAVGTYQRERTA